MHQPILELEANRAELNCVVPLVKTNIEGFIFFKGTDAWSRCQSNVITDAIEVAAYVHDYFRTCVAATKARRDAHSQSKSRRSSSGRGAGGDPTTPRRDGGEDGNGGSKKGPRRRFSMRLSSFLSPKRGGHHDAVDEGVQLTPEMLKSHNLAYRREVPVHRVLKILQAQSVAEVDDEFNKV